MTAFTPVPSCLTPKDLPHPGTSSASRKKQTQLLQMFPFRHLGNMLSHNALLLPMLPPD